GFLGASNLLPGTAAGDEAVRLDDGTEVRVTRDALDGRVGRVAVGIRPEKIQLGEGQANELAGKLRERAYVGVATQYVVETSCGDLTVYAQNVQRGITGPSVGERLTLSWSPESTLVVDSTEGADND